MNYMSESIKDLAGALAKAQAEFKVAEKNQKNPFFKSNYADFQSIVASSRPALAKNGLSVSQTIVLNEQGEQLLVSTLMHSSGEWMKSASKITPVKTDIQSFSSYITYLKRISYASLVGVVTGDEDDDGEHAVRGSSVAPTQQYSYQKKSTELVTDDQVEQLEMELRGYEKIQTKVLDALKIDHLSQMPKERFMYSINRIRELKALLTQK